MPAMAGKGSPKGVRQGGRQKGTRNKKTAAMIEGVQSSGLTPLEYLIGIVRDESKDEIVRVDAAKAAAPYIHPRLSAVELSGGIGINHETALGQLK